MPGKALAVVSAMVLTSVPTAASAKEPAGAPRDGVEQDIVKQDRVKQNGAGTGGQSYGDRNRGGPYGFYSYPRHRSVDGGGSALDRRSPSIGSAGTSPHYDSSHGSAYYGRDYGAPYYGGGYYDGGTYYRERRD